MSRKFRLSVVLIVVFGVGAPLPGQIQSMNLKVDIGMDGQPVAEGFFGLSSHSGTTAEPKTFTNVGGSGIDVTLETTYDGNDLGFRTVGGGVLCGDLVHNDNRAGGIIVILSGLEPRDYSMTSYHNDPRRHRSDMNVYVDSELVLGSVPQSAVTDDDSAATAVFDFTILPGSNEVVIAYIPIPIGDWQYDRIAINGFVLEWGDEVYAYNPRPANGEKDVEPAVVFRWDEPEDVCSPVYDVYFDSDVNFPSGGLRTDSNSFDPEPDLAYGTVYYWRVDVVDSNGGGPVTYEGELWTFTTKECGAVEDFDSYADTNDLLSKWTDGSVNGSGATVELEEEFGGQSMKFRYNNSGPSFYSEASLRFSSAQDWTEDDVMAVSLWYKGDPNIDELYIRLADSNNSDVQRIRDVNVIQSGAWIELSLELDSFLGVDLRRVRQMTLGAGREAGEASEAGTVYFDDIRLYPARCFLEYTAAADLTGDCVVDNDDLRIVGRDWLLGDYNVAAQAPDGNHLRVHYKFDETSGFLVHDFSVNSYHGTIDTNDVNGVWDANGSDGRCIRFDGTFSVLVPDGVFAGISGAVTVSMWLYNDANESIESELEFDAGPIERKLWERLVWRQGQGGNNWRHYSVVKDAAEWLMRIYDNGLVVAQSQEAFVPMDGGSAGPTKIGATGDGDYGYYKGRLDDFRVYDYALTHAEVLYLAAGNFVEMFQPLTPALSRADFNEDGKINFRDYVFVADAWLSEYMWP